MMKKTLVALALAATTVSGSAMAWTANGTGGTLDLGGTLTPESVVSPWEVLIGSAVTDLDAPIKTGSTKVDIPVKKAITVLGIRTQTNQAFAGQVGISPQIDFKGAYDTAKQVSSTGLLSLDVLDTKSGSTIGSLQAPMLSGGIVSAFRPADKAGYQHILYAANSGEAFFGGVAANGDNVGDGTTVAAELEAINPEFSANYNTQSQAWTQSKMPETFGVSAFMNSGYYGSGIQVGKNMTLTLTTPAASDAITWKASLPITVSYQ